MQDDIRHTISTRIISFNFDVGVIVAILVTRASGKS